MSDTRECIYIFYSFYFIHSLCLSRVAISLSAVSCVRLALGFRDIRRIELGIGSGGIGGKGSTV